MQKEMKKETRGGYNKSTFFIKLFSILLLCAAIIGGAFFAFPLKNKNADAMSSIDTINVGDILLSDYSNRNDYKFCIFNHIF